MGLNSSLPSAIGDSVEVGDENERAVDRSIEATS